MAPRGAGSHVKTLYKWNMGIFMRRQVGTTTKGKLSLGAYVLSFFKTVLKAGAHTIVPLISIVKGHLGNCMRAFWEQ